MREFIRLVHGALWRPSGRQVGVGCTIAATGALLTACALPVSVPGMSLDDTATGSIKPVAISPFSAEMDAEDWRRAKSALETALDPQGNGAKVAWDNPKSGAKGAFIPLAQPFPKDDGICRAFTASVETSGQTARMVRSSACRRNGGEWIVGKIVPVDTKPTAKSAKIENLAERDIHTHLN